MELKIGVNCNVYSNLNSLIVEGEVVSLESDFVRLKYIKHYFPEYKQEEVLTIALNGNNMIYQGKVHFLTKEVLVLSELTFVSVANRRDYYRINVDLEAKACLWSEDKAIEKVFFVNIHNLSSTGVLIKSEQHIPLNVEFMIQLPILGDNTNSILLEIRRREYDSIQEKNLYGCEFMNCDKHTKEKIVQYMFEEEKNMLNKRKDLQV